MFKKLAEFFGGDKYAKYLAQCEKDGTKPLSKELWQESQPKKSC